jgi:hypothetical protein
MVARLYRFSYVNSIASRVTDATTPWRGFHSGRGRGLPGDDTHGRYEILLHVCFGGTKLVQAKTKALPQFKVVIKQRILPAQEDTL